MASKDEVFYNEYKEKYMWPNIEKLNKVVYQV